VASPSATELETQLKNAVALLDHLFATNTVVADINTYEQSLESDFVVEQARGAALVRSSVAAALAAAPEVLGPIMQAYAHHIVGKASQGVDDAITLVYDYFKANSKTIKERNFTYGTPTAAGGNTGNGTMRRLVLDEDTVEIEAAHPEVKTAEIIRDATSGARAHEETLEMRGAAEGRDALDVSGSGLIQSLPVVASNQSLVANPTFSQYTIAGTVTSGSPYTLVSGDTITSWTVSDVTLVTLTITAADIYRSVEGDSTPTALRLNNNVTLTQTFADAGIDLQALIPYDLLVPIKRESSADGTFTASLGATSKATTVSGLSNGVYNAVFLDLNQGLWPKNITETAADLVLAWAGRSTGTLVLDEITLVAFNQIDGNWWVLHSGATPFLLADTFSITDTAVDSKIQKWLWRAFNRYLPHAAVPTIADPA